MWTQKDSDVSLIAPTILSISELILSVDHHENMSSSSLRALQDVVVPLDPRAGRIVITPSPSLKPNYSPYRHIDDIPNRSIDDLQDPEELHSHANMIYGIDEAHASQYSVPDWQEGEAATFIEEASHGFVVRDQERRPLT